MLPTRLKICLLLLLPLVAMSAWGLSLIWSYEAHLPAPVNTSQFASSVALNGNLGLVGSSPQTAVLYQAPPPNTPLPPHLWLKVQQFVPQSGATGLFGRAVALDVDRLAIGAPYGDPQLVNNGYVDLYERSGSSWSFVQKVVPTSFDIPPPLHPELFFGDLMVLKGDTLIVGSQHFYDTAGRVFVFERNGGLFNQTQQLKPPIDVRETAFGGAIALSGDTLAIGRGGRGGAGSGPNGMDEPLVAGEVHVYVRSNGLWVVQQVLTAPDGEVSNEFGRALDLHGNRLVVRSKTAVYLFVRSGGVWTSPWQHAVTGSPTAGVVLRPSGVKTTEDDLFVGNPNKSLGPGLESAGHVLRFTGAPSGPGFVAHGSLQDPSPTANARFGQSLSASGDRLLVGAPSTVVAETRARVFRAQMPRRVSP